jgi:hypothetical protein
MRKALAWFLVVFQAGLCASGALAAWPAGSDPWSNFKPKFPSSCSHAPTGRRCLRAGVHYLNQARSHLRQPPYKLPANFVDLAPDRQILILTNLDRGLYHLQAIGGGTAELNRDALAGVRADNDPHRGVRGFVNDTHFQYFGSNWAYGYPNIVFAYGAWMYDDGPGGPNLLCSQTNKSDCWGHRHNVLLELPKQASISGPTAMGASAGNDRSGHRGYAMLLGRGDSGYKPRYLFNWSDHHRWW